MIKEQIEDKLQQHFTPQFLEVLNESQQHNVPRGAESHFKVVIVSDSFIGQRLLARHRLVYGLLQEELQTAVHALALHTYTSSEWQTLDQHLLASPACHGGGRSL
jgi:BolA family transcriptional regulator, general stress-responsive regulator